MAARSTATTSTRRRGPTGRLSDVAAAGSAGGGRQVLPFPRGSGAGRAPGSGAWLAAPPGVGDPPGIGSEFPHSRCRCREPVHAGRCLPGDLVGQRAEHREPGDAIRQHVIHDDEQPGAAIGQPGDECGRPQRPGPRHGFGELSRSEIKQGPLVPGRRPRASRTCSSISNAGSPPSTAGRGQAAAVRPLPEPRDRPGPLAEHPAASATLAPARGRASSRPRCARQLSRPRWRTASGQQRWPGQPGEPPPVHCGVRVMTDQPYSSAASSSSVSVGDGALLARMRRMRDLDELLNRNSEADDRDHQSSQADRVSCLPSHWPFGPDHREGEGNVHLVPRRHNPRRRM